MAGREGRRKLPRRQTSFRTVALLMLLPVVGVLLFVAYRFLLQIVPTPQREVVRDSTIAPAPKRHGRIALILDDVGFDHQPIERAMTIDPKLNFSILPNARFAVPDANLLSAHGFEVLCHLPMEPDGFPKVSPGPGAVLTTMSDEEIVRATRANVGAVPHARGVNNHMGSRATADRRVMSDVLHALPHGMYFIDSRTTPESVGATLAHRMAIRTGARNVFLDDVPHEAEIRRQLLELARDADAHGVAIGIGHMYPETIAVLAREVPRLRRDGFVFVRASEAVR